MKKFTECWGMQFENLDYNPTWMELDPITKNPFKLGTVRERCDGVGFTVYDGATNYMGYVDMKGEVHPDGYASSYVMSFLKHGKMAVEANFMKLS